ncbi:MAG: replication-associated recombination protein A [Holosporaceae bacterium]|jgi:putative ATPase|nr:replication-associated recombination protein A [Holosporaceae bacterium]
MILGENELQLFEQVAPLADRIRPQELEDLIGQQVGERISSYKNLQSLILWGPPGSGKTSFAKILARKSGLKFQETSAVIHATAKFKEIFDELSYNPSLKMIILLDEIHHLNKSQQDIFLPYLENGSLILIGTTTENPSFELRPALLSRCKVITFSRLQLEDLEKILQRAEDFMKKELPLTAEARQHLCLMSDGDGRYLLNRAEELLSVTVREKLSVDGLQKIASPRAIIYDKSKEEHYNLISALHKSLRGSDVDASLYWVHRMLIAGENPLYIIRRLIRFASEDIGLADPNALTQAIAAHQAYTMLGSPEGELAISNAVVYMATAPKSNAGYVAHKQSERCAEFYGSLPPPKRILNAPTQLMTELGYGEGYIYDHDAKHAFVGENFFPDELSRKTFYRPVERGFEREIKKRVDWWNNKRKKD